MATQRRTTTRKERKDIHRIARHVREQAALSGASTKKILGASAEDLDEGNHDHYFRVNGSNKTYLVGFDSTAWNLIKSELITMSQIVSDYQKLQSSGV